jgi:hypothetical protein
MPAKELGSAGVEIDFWLAIDRAELQMVPHCSGVEIDIGPAESQRFAELKAGHAHDEEQGVQPVIIGSVQERAQLADIPRWIIHCDYLPT